MSPSARRAIRRAILRRPAQFSDAARNSLTPPCDAPGTEAEQEAEHASLQAYFNVDGCKEGGSILVHTSALPTILYHYEDTLAEESENSTRGRHAPTRQAGLSEMLCVVGRLLLRKVLTSYQSALEEEQNQQV